MPKVLLLKGVWRMLGRSPIPAYVFGVSIALTLELLLLRVMLADSSVGLIALICMLPFSALGIITASAVSAFWLAVLTESAKGNDRLYNPPGPVFLD